MGLRAEHLGSAQNFDRLDESLKGDDSFRRTPVQ